MPTSPISFQIYLVAELMVNTSIRICYECKLFGENTFCRSPFGCSSSKRDLSFVKKIQAQPKPTQRKSKSFTFVALHFAQNGFVLTEQGEQRLGMMTAWGRCWAVSVNSHPHPPSCIRPKEMFAPKEVTELPEEIPSNKIMNIALTAKMSIRVMVGAIFFATFSQSFLLRVMPRGGTFDCDTLHFVKNYLEQKMRHCTKRKHNTQYIKTSHE